MRPLLLLSGPRRASTMGLRYFVPDSALMECIVAPRIKSACQFARTKRNNNRGLTKESGVRVYVDTLPMTRWGHIDLMPNAHMFVLGSVLIPPVPSLAMQRVVSKFMETTVPKPSANIPIRMRMSHLLRIAEVHESHQVITRVSLRADPATNA